MSIYNLAISSVLKGQAAYCKFITANDTGTTGGHQSGFHIHKSAWKLLFDKPGEKGANKELFVEIKWQDSFVTNSRFIYYGVGTRDEYRITRFGKGFQFLKDDNVGDLLVISKHDKLYYEAFVLSEEDEIESFFAGVNISITQANTLIDVNKVKTTLEAQFSDFLKQLKAEFPTSLEMSKESQKIYNYHNSIDSKQMYDNPDSILIGWIDMEYQLFKTIEAYRYADILQKPFGDIEKLIVFSNTILNRRKSRAGKSLENHLAEIFTRNDLRFEQQAKTEGNKKPDFIFPGSKEYKDTSFSFEKLAFLGAKTTCKDRWRQILNEANRIPDKHLFTLQQGISKNQLQEMKDERVTLVVPYEYFKFYPVEFRSDLMSLNSFIGFVRSRQ